MNTAMIKTFIFLSLIASTSFAQSMRRVAEPISITAVVHTPIKFKFDIVPKPNWTNTDKIQIFGDQWTVPPKFSIIKHTDGTMYAWAPVGQYEVKYSSIIINWTKQDIDQREFIATIKVIPSGDPEPPPDPTPEPPPPQPDNPLPGTGLKVLLIEEQEQRATIPKEQDAIFTSAIVRDYMDMHCVKDASGVPEWRLLDKNTTFSSENQWKKALSLPRTKDWWVVISNGKNWESRELPANVNDMMTLLKKYGEPQ